ncbi:MAG: histone deacetylase [Chloroflexi bacterium]|nr:MAG: histone deacetylase [Chloroflexota bacterium]RLC86001.1 MAG: histone deacetylase [Chloroflexota bacterium]
MNTAYVYDPIYLEHDLPSHPENARRLKRILNTLEDEGMLARLRHLKPRPATAEELQCVHTPEHIERVRRTAQTGGGYLDPDTYVSSRSFDAALMAAGGVVRAVEGVLTGEIANAFALVRPPGHHATATRAMGFCLFNNIAVAAKAALTGGQAQRVFIADFDVHHGNGTQDAFADDPAVFYFSTHQYPYYPGTGHWRETGYGAGEGTVLNVPLPPGVGDAGFAQIYAELVWPLAERFRPNLMLVSAGYDAHWSDPLAQMNLSLTGYARLQRELVHMAGHLCDGRIVFTLEGGYQLDVLAHGVLNAFYAMLGEETITDPIGPSPHPEQSVDALITHLREVHGLD